MSIPRQPSQSHANSHNLKSIIQSSYRAYNRIIQCGYNSMQGRMTSRATYVRLNASNCVRMFPCTPSLPALLVDHLFFWAFFASLIPFHSLSPSPCPLFRSPVPRLSVPNSSVLFSLLESPSPPILDGGRNRSSALGAPSPPLLAAYAQEVHCHLLDPFCRRHIGPAHWAVLGALVRNQPNTQFGYVCGGCDLHDRADMEVF